MKSRTHREITKAVCSAVGILYGEEVAEANVWVDKSPDTDWRGRRIPHHSREGLDAGIYWLKRARNAYTNSDGMWTVYLGRALHYIQDYCVDPRVKGWIFRSWSDEAHREREGELRIVPVPEDAISAGIRDSSSFSGAMGIIKRATPRTNPKDVMWQATYLSAVAANGVTSLIEHPWLSQSSSSRSLSTGEKLLLILLSPIWVPLLLLFFVGLFAGALLLGPFLPLAWSIWRVGKWAVNRSGLGAKWGEWMERLRAKWREWRGRRRGQEAEAESRNESTTTSS